MIMRRIRTGFYSDLPDTMRVYEGENILRVVKTREAQGSEYLLLEDGQWIRPIGSDQYVTDWNSEECWGRVEEVETNDKTGEELSIKELGFSILRIDRARGLRLHRVDPHGKSVSAGSAKSASADPTLCRGCRICVKTCPVSAIRISDKKAVVAKSCIACRACIKICPFHAIAISSR